MKQSKVLNSTHQYKVNFKPFTARKKKEIKELQKYSFIGLFSTRGVILFLNSYRGMHP